MILHSGFGLIWTTPWLVEKDLFLKFAFREIRKFPYEKLTFFLYNYSKISFSPRPNYTGDTPYQVWLYLDICLNRWKRPIFEILWSQFNRNNRKFPYENPTFFLGKVCQKFFLLYTLITLVILDTKFGLIWTLPWPDEKELFLKFAIRKKNISYSKISFSPTLYLHRGYSIPSLVWFEQLLNPIKNNYI